MVLRVLLLFITYCLIHTPIALANTDSPLKAAFIRDKQLWMLEGNKEQQLTTDQYVRSPKWSRDGRFIAYIDSDENGEKSNLWVYDTQTQKNYQPYETIETRDFQWSPISNQIAYNSRGILNVTKIMNGLPMGFENVVLGVSDFVWMPSGEGFIVSSQADLLPTGWGPIPLFKVPIDAKLDGSKVKPFYTIETDKDLFAIDANYFKWSEDNRWLSFLAIPTASWANDSNTLCVLSSKGDQFQVIGNMLWYSDWFKWAPKENKLAYISGEGRFLVTDKKTKIADIPISSQQKEYTPKGYVDLDLDWFSENEVIVARAVENKEWDEGPVPTMHTSLYVINIISGEQRQITFPANEEYDRSPQAIQQYVTWVRKDEASNNVLIKEGLEGKEKIWLRGVDEVPEIFESKNKNLD
ncbi:translocation protein TolB [Bacillus sp. LL01]|uniref:hypothetical protein n=1 Tax=Bacillus sp. LL01 TaxID=1665556 RepID=UPI00064D0297|nr:hypothetical protein [Bacillus sp. LL01]KMJ59860.1 translocation protein TolB [Bacillus sp. LL01]